MRAFWIAALGAALLTGCTDSAMDAPGAGTDPNAVTDTAAGAGGIGDIDSTEYFESVIGDRVYFATDEFTLDSAAQTTLDEQADWLSRNPGVGARIEGHADERGTREYNLALGARRAAAVRNFLVGEGVAPGRLRTVTYGKERPEALCSDESCWRLNRRAVTVMADAPVS